MSCLDKFHILEIENLSVVFHQYAKKDKKAGASGYFKSQCIGA